MCDWEDGFEIVAVVIVLLWGPARLSSGRLVVQYASMKREQRVKGYGKEDV